ncbi:MAG TPA: hypothetical protein VK387_00320 [Thermoleophilaceae bacterium]|nr:hypothetical protein [Thermoleophilaceae bacterium]
MHCALTLSGALLLVGFVVNAIQRSLLHPLGPADDHKAIFTECAASDVWVATHLAEFLLVLVAFAGLLVLCYALRQETPYLALLAAGAPSRLRGYGPPSKVSMGSRSSRRSTLGSPRRVARRRAASPMLKACAGSSGASRATSGSCSALPCCSWALRQQRRLVSTWLGALLAFAGLLSLTVGISVGYAGFESSFQDAVAIAFQLVFLVFAVGLLVVGRRAREPGTSAAST